MACTCKEDKFLVLHNGMVDEEFHPELVVEVPWDGVTDGQVIGRNRVQCAECIENVARQERTWKKQELLAQIKDLEGRIFYSQLDGDAEFVAKKMADRAVLKEQLKGL